MSRIIIILFLFSTTNLFAQPEKAKSEKEIVFKEDQFEINYKKRIKKERIHGVYIPADLTDAFVQLNILIAPKAQAKFKRMPEEMASTKLHLSLGRWIIYNWGFYEGSRLSHHIKKTIGISHPDDMARFIITLYHRSLNKKPLNVKELVEKFDVKRQEAIEKKKNESKVIHSEKRIRQQND